MNTPKKNQSVIQLFDKWLLSQKWLWKKVVFDNGNCGSNYHRYDHRILSYCQGMGDNSENGDVNTAIKWSIESFNRNLA